MTDYLLVHGAGQGAWSWGRVWGYLTAPVEHPPSLYKTRRANRVYPLDLPGHGADAEGDTGDVRLEECVQAIPRVIERQGLKDVVVVAHGFAASIVLQASTQLQEPPKRIVLLAGMVPQQQRSMVSVLPSRARIGFKAMSAMSGLVGKGLKLPRGVIYNQLCNGMDPMEVVHSLGHFGPIPTKVMTTKVSLEQAEPPSPVTYVVLSQDKVLPPDLQYRMARRVPGAEVVNLDACHQVMLSNPKELADLLLSYA
jgi:pimeloyl-ACP methyl ester carboxylesterase